MPRSAGILDRPLPSGRAQVSLSAFSFLFSEIVQYTKAHPTVAREVTTWESRLHNVGYGVGTRMLDLLTFRAKAGDVRQTSLIPMLTFIQRNVWKVLFGREADGLQKIRADKDGDQAEDIYLIVDADPLVCRYVCNPPNNVSSAAFVAGLLQGFLDGAEFPAEIFAHHGETAEVAYQINFRPHVFAREERAVK